MRVNVICLVYLAIVALVPARLQMEGDEIQPQLNLERVASITKPFKDNNEERVPLPVTQDTAATQQTEAPSQVGGPTTPPPMYKVQTKLYKGRQNVVDTKPLKVGSALWRRDSAFKRHEAWVSRTSTSAAR